MIVPAALASLLAACASAPTPPYPAFIRTADLPDAFVASLPGIRAKVLAGNPDTRRSSSVLTLPADWSFTTGGFPDKSVELYVLAGTVTLGEFELDSGGYAYIPAGTTGFELATGPGARVLYFLDDDAGSAVIGTPLITDSDLLAWTSSEDIDAFGFAEKTLRDDPGSGARTWLLRVQPGATLPWRRDVAGTEGYLLAGQYRHAECVDGEPATGEYAPGGYFHRPSGAVHGGPEAAAQAPAVWYLRRLRAGDDIVVAGCTAAAIAGPNP